MIPTVRCMANGLICRPFADNRFIDRFEVRDGKITRMDVCGIYLRRVDFSARHFR